MAWSSNKTERELKFQIDEECYYLYPGDICEIDVSREYVIRARKLPLSPVPFHELPEELRYSSAQLEAQSLRADSSNSSIQWFADTIQKGIEEAEPGTIKKLSDALPEAKAKARPKKVRNRKV